MQQSSGSLFLPRRDHIMRLVIDPRRPSDKLDDYSHALIGMRVNSQSARFFQGRFDHKTTNAACERETMNPLAFDHLAPGWCDRD
jgi:hypothetical protein